MLHRGAAARRVRLVAEHLGQRARREAVPLAELPLPLFYRGSWNPAKELGAGGAPRRRGLRRSTKHQATQPVRDAGAGAGAGAGGRGRGVAGGHGGCCAWHC